MMEITCLEGVCLEAFLIGLTVRKLDEFTPVSLGAV